MNGGASFPPSTVEKADGGDADRSLLRLLGYKQELQRGLSVVSNFAFSFSIIGVLVTTVITFNTGLQFGGPFTITVGWLLAAPLNACVALAMAEICSAFPTSGGLYYWSSRLAGDRWGPLASWMTGWFNMVGLWVGNASGAFALSQLIQVMVLLSTGGANNGGYLASKYVVIAIYGAILITVGFINSLPISRLSIFAKLGAIWNILGIFAFTVLVPAVATEKASLKYMFTHFNLNNGVNISDKFYIFVLGLLMTQFTLLGYDASAHMTEETKNAALAGPLGIITSVGVSIVFGWIYLVALASAVTDIPFLLSPTNDAGGYGIAQLFYIIFQRRFGSGVGGIVCIGYVAVNLYFCCVTTVASTSRMTYAFSRDRAVPLSGLWYSVTKEEVPLNAVWLCILMAFCIGLTSLGSQVAFQAMASIVTIALYIAYTLPIFFRITTGRRTFVPGPFNLGRLSIPIGWAAVLWVTALTVFFSLPLAYPIEATNFNYTPVAIGGLLGLTVGGWVLSGQHWFEGPVRTVDNETELD